MESVGNYEIFLDMFELYGKIKDCKVKVYLNYAILSCPFIISFSFYKQFKNSILKQPTHPSLAIALISLRPTSSDPHNLRKHFILKINFQHCPQMENLF